MGDWSIGTSWAFAPDDESALGMYQWFEEMARQMDRGEVSYPSVMRFGFVTPRLIVSIWSQKWGESDLTHEIKSNNPAIALITSQSEIALSGALAHVQACDLFAWSPKPEVMETLAAGGFEPRRCGGAKVSVLDEASTREFWDAVDRPPPDEDSWRAPPAPAPLARALLSGSSAESERDVIVIGAIMREHGLVQSAQIHSGWDRAEITVTADAMRLKAPRGGGGSNGHISADGVQFLPQSGVAGEDDWVMSRHGAHLIWQPPGQRAELLARAESEPAQTAGLRAREHDGGAVVASLGEPFGEAERSGLLGGGAPRERRLCSLQGAAHA